MDRGTDFLKAQINNAVMQHGAFVQNLHDHEAQAVDSRFRDLCGKYIAQVREHQRMLEDYQKEIGAELGLGKKALGKALGVARDLADAARESDFLRLVGDIVTSRQSEDTFKTFREAGKMLGNQRLQQIGEAGERLHDEYSKESNRLIAHMFVEHVRNDTTGASASSSTAATAAGAETGSNPTTGG